MLYFEVLMLLIQRHQASSALTILNAFGLQHLAKEFADGRDGSAIHDLRNVLILEMSVRHAFDRLLVYFDSIPVRIYLLISVSAQLSCHATRMSQIRTS